MHCNGILLGLYVALRCRVHGHSLHAVVVSVPRCLDRLLVQCLVFGTVMSLSCSSFLVSRGFPGDCDTLRDVVDWLKGHDIECREDFVGLVCPADGLGARSMANIDGGSKFTPDVIAFLDGLVQVGCLFAGWLLSLLFLSCCKEVDADDVLPCLPVLALPEPVTIQREALAPFLATHQQLGHFVARQAAGMFRAAAPRVRCAPYRGGDVR